MLLCDTYYGFCYIIDWLYMEGVKCMDKENQVYLHMMSLPLLLRLDEPAEQWV